MHHCHSGTFIDTENGRGTSYKFATVKSNMQTSNHLQSLLRGLDWSKCEQLPMYSMLLCMATYSKDIILSFLFFQLYVTIQPEILQMGRLQ